MSEEKTVRRINRPVRGSNNSVKTQADFQVHPSNITGKTFKSLCDAGLIKSGMAVKFTNPSFNSIVLTPQQTGVKKNQVISGILENGIVVKNANGEMSIIVKAIFKEPLTLHGRYGLAYGKQTLKDLTDRIVNQVINSKECEVILPTVDSFEYYFDKSLFFEDYMYASTSKNRREFFLTSGLNVSEYRRYVFGGLPSAGSSVSGHLLIELDAKNLICNLNNMVAQESNEPYSYTNSPFETFVEID